MGNRSFLYVISASGERCEQFAEANNNFPVLWQILLADGEPGTAIEDQRVFGNNNTDNLVADAAAALARVKTLAAFVREHPMLPRLPEIAQQFDGLEIYLAQLIDGHRDNAGEAPKFSANLDELSWMDDEPPEQFIDQCRAECDERWARLSAAIFARDFPALDEALGLNEYGGSFEKWENWGWGFGFTGLSHDYFAMQSRPRSERFADFVPEANDDDDDDDEEMRSGFRRLVQDSQVGLQKQDENGEWKTLLAPEWDELWFATPRALWVRRGRRFGLVCLLGDKAQLLVPPELNSAGRFVTRDDGTPPCAVVIRDGRAGLLREDGSWLLEPSLDELGYFENGYASFRVGTKYGYIDGTGKTVIPAIYDSVSPISPAGVGAVGLDKRYGLIRANGEIVQPLDYDHADWDGHIDAFVFRKGNKKGLWHADGSPWLAPEWKSFTRLVDQRLLAVRGDKHVGIVDWQGRTVLPVEFDNIEPFVASPADSDDEGAIEWLVVRQGGKLGLADLAGNIVVPPDYYGLAFFAPLPPEDGDFPAARQLLRVERKTKGNPVKFGVFDLASRKEVLPCQYDRLLLVALGGKGFGYLAASEKPPVGRKGRSSQCYGILHSDGSILIPFDYAWFYDNYDLDGPWERSIVCHHIHQQWQNGKRLRAERSDDGRFVWLDADGDEMGHVDYLSRRFAEGDLEAALTLGRDYRDGNGVKQDEPLARCWLARAAGVAESDAGNPEWLRLPADTAAPDAKSGGGIFRAVAKLLTGRRPPAAPPSTDSPPGLFMAMYELAMMFRNGEGGSVSEKLARYWLVQAASSGGKQHVDTMASLGYFLTNGIGGDLDMARGILVYDQAAQLGSAYASFNLGHIYEAGEGVAVDTARAMDYYRRSAKLGDGEAAYAYGRLLRLAAKQQAAGEQRKQLGEAAYWLRKGCNAEDSRFNGSACAELALIHLDREAAEYNLDHAEKRLLRGAELDDTRCMGLLISEFYANADNGRRDDAKSTYWTRRQIETEAKQAGDTPT